MEKENIHPMVKFMAKKITVSMLEAHFNALPELLRYMIQKGETDLDARLALHNFEVESKKERICLDPSEAVMGFAANLIQSGIVPEDRKGALSGNALKFCLANNLGELSEDWAEKLKLTNLEK